MKNVMQTGLKREEKVDKANQREEEHLELLRWINSNKDYEFPFMLIKGKEWNRFMQSDIEDDIMDMIIIDCDEFYTKFKEIIGVQLLEISNFISMTYIDETQNDIEVVIVNADDKQEKFVIGV